MVTVLASRIPYTLYFFEFKQDIILLILILYLFSIGVLGTLDHAAEF